MRLAALILAASALPAATLDKSARNGNLVILELSDGTAQVEWLSDSSFRFSRRWAGKFPPRAAREAVSLTISDKPDSLIMATKYLLVTIGKRGVLVRVAEPDGTPIMADASEAEQRDGAIRWERAAPEGVRFFGLGARDDAAVELRGSLTAAAKPFLISSGGYGEYHVAPGEYLFDVGRASSDRYRVAARGASEVDYYFFFGPTPKEILEQYLLVDDPAGKGSPCRTIRCLINGSMSGILLPAPSLDPSLLPDGLSAYFAAYAQETHDRGLPLVRALPMQFPKDAEAAKVSDEFMLGDELLLARSRRVYLPMGIWTRLSDNRVFPGKQTIALEGGEPQVFSRNGMILPLGSDPMTLHYFPKLGGEFFVFEADLEEYSQVHAAPAGDFMRLEIESKKDREYEWVVHHVERPRKVSAGTWTYDATKKNLHVRVRARAGGDEIVSIAF